MTFQEQVELATYAHGSLVGISIGEFNDRINSVVVDCSTFCTFERLTFCTFERLHLEGVAGGSTAERCTRCGFVLLAAGRSYAYLARSVVVAIEADDTIVLGLR